MVLHLDEYEKERGVVTELHYYDKLEEYLHEMNTTDIMIHINRNGVNSVWSQKEAILGYFRWLYDSYNIDTTEKVYELQKMLSNNNVSYVGFLCLDELKSAIKSFQNKIESQENNRDFSGLFAMFYLEWYGILIEDALNVLLSDVSNDGKEIHLSDRVVNIDDDEVSEYISWYKAKTGRIKRSKINDDEELQETIMPYVQNTFFRTTRESKDPYKQYYNIKQFLIKTIEFDSRVQKNRIYDSGNFSRLLKIEHETATEFIGDSSTLDIFRTVYNQPDLQHNNFAKRLNTYRTFKKAFLEKYSL